MSSKSEMQFLEPAPYYANNDKGRVISGSVTSVPVVPVAPRTGATEQQFIEPAPYFAKNDKGKVITRPVRNVSADPEPQFAEPRPYWISNEMAEIDELRQQVLRLDAAVGRAAEGSAERLEAQRQLITARSDLRIAARSRASALEASLGALKRPGASESERLRLESELQAVKTLLEAIEDERQDERDRAQTGEGSGPITTGKTGNQRAPRVLNSWRNSLGELVEQTDVGLRVSGQPPQPPAVPDVYGEAAEGSPTRFRMQLHMAARRASALSDEELAREMAAAGVATQAT